MTVPRGKRPADPNKLAKWLVEESTAEPAPDPPPIIPMPAELSAYMAALGRRGGMVGGKRRLLTMTPEKRREAAAKAAQARWKKQNQSQTPEKN